jgi:hypothetical protein
MRAVRLSFVALLGVATVMVATPEPGFALMGHFPVAKGQAVNKMENAGYRYRRWGHRPYYRPYYGGYYRPYYYRPYYGYPYYYRPYYRPWWPGISFGFWF